MNKELTKGFVIFTKEEIDLLEKVSPSALSMYFHLKKRVNNKRGDNMAFPGGKTLLKEMGYSPKSKGTLAKTTRELEGVGLINVDRHYDAEKRVRRVNKYYLILGGRATQSQGRATEELEVVPQSDHNKYESNKYESNYLEEIEKDIQDEGSTPSPVEDVANAPLAQAARPATDYSKLEERYISLGFIPAFLTSKYYLWEAKKISDADFDIALTEEESKKAERERFIAEVRTEREGNNETTSR